MAATPPPKIFEELQNRLFKSVFSPNNIFILHRTIELLEDICPELDPETTVFISYLGNHIFNHASDEWVTKAFQLLLSTIDEYQGLLILRDIRPDLFQDQSTRVKDKNLSACTDLLSEISSSFPAAYNWGLSIKILFEEIREKTKDRGLPEQARVFAKVQNYFDLIRSRIKPAQ